MRFIHTSYYHLEFYKESSHQIWTKVTLFAEESMVYSSSGADDVSISPALEKVSGCQIWTVGTSFEVESVVHSSLMTLLFCCHVNLTNPFIPSYG